MWILFVGFWGRFPCFSNWINFLFFSEDVSFCECVFALSNPFWAACVQSNYYSNLQGYEGQMK